MKVNATAQMMRCVDCVNILIAYFIDETSWRRVISFSDEVSGLNQVILEQCIVEKRLFRSYGPKPRPCP